jgi:hypothetical protein
MGPVPRLPAGDVADERLLAVRVTAAREWAPLCPFPEPLTAALAAWQALAHRDGIASCDTAETSLRERASWPELDIIVDNCVASRTRSQLRLLHPLTPSGRCNVKPQPTPCRSVR